jgi:DNA-directed RNA polymerase subunit M/transcription elongation factor TFIIS
MSELFDKLVESAGQVISEVDKGGQIQSAISGLRGRLAEAERKRKVNQIKGEMRDLQSQEAQAINALSAQVLALYEAGSLTQPELVSLCKGVDEIRARIEEKEAELGRLQPATPEPTAEARCPTCGAPTVTGATFCQSCGTRLVATEEAPSPPARFCVHCGAELRERARFCPKCGQTLPQG